MKFCYFWQYNSFIVKLKKNVLIEAHKNNLTKQHSELFYWTSNEQFKSKMDLPLKKVGKITSASLTIASLILCAVRINCKAKFSTSRRQTIMSAVIFLFRSDVTKNGKFLASEPALFNHLF